MRLRRPCGHGQYDDHAVFADPPIGYDSQGRSELIVVTRCPGGEFLAEDAVVIAWCKQHHRLGDGPDHCEDGDPDSPRDDWCRMVQALLVPLADALAVRDSEG